MGKDYYSILGVDKQASQDEIKKAFRKMAHKHHPDKEGGDESKFKEVNEAYQVIGDEQKRQQYDQYGSTFDQQGGFGGGMSWDDIMRASRGGGGFNGQNMHFQFGGNGADGFDLGDIFGSMFGFGNPNRPRKGRDVQVDVEITLQDAIAGIEKDIHFFIQTQTGKEERKFTVKIPAGIDSGQSIRVSEKGQPSPNGGQNGDVFVLIHVKPDTRFAREGEHIFTEKRIRYSQAVLGDTVEIDTIHGTKKIAIPAGTLSHTQIRIKGEGMPSLHGRGNKGDHYVKVIIDVPKKVDRHVKNCLSNWMT